MRYLQALVLDGKKTKNMTYMSLFLVESEMTISRACGY